jgi:hypothetical protein
MKKRLGYVLVLALAVCVAGWPAARAGWVQDGVAICAAISYQGQQQMVPDGLGGAIIVWEDMRNGFESDIYAQRVAADGSVMWQIDGVAVCLAAGSQQRLQVAPDGLGGVIVAWEDHRSSSTAPDIYAQRIDGTGAPLWTADGVAVCTASGLHEYPMLASDGAGGAVIGWTDLRSGTSTEIYLQKIDAAGTAVWNHDGFPLYPAGNTPWRQIIPDGPGGAIVAWISFSGQNVYAQKIAPNGAVQWTADAALVCSAIGVKTRSALVSDGSGGAVIAWEDERNGGHGHDIYMQRLNSGGAPLWTADGVAVCTATGDQQRAVLAPDGSGGAVVSWQDMRFGSLTDQIAVYSQKVDMDGSALWAADGICVGSVGMVNDIAADGSGGAILAWFTYLGGISKGYVQRLDAGGSPQWTPGGVSLRAASNQFIPTLVTDGVGGAIVAWTDYLNLGSPATADIYALRFDDAGTIPIATLLQGYDVSLTGGAPTISWTLSSIDPGAELFVARAGSVGESFVDRPSRMTTGSDVSFIFVDEECEPGASYWYRVGIRAGAEKETLFETGRVTIPGTLFALMQNNPNPFNPTTTIGYYIPVAGRVTLDVYDSSGRLVNRLLDRAAKQKGTHSVEWRGVDAQGRRVSSGVYFYRLTSGKETISKKMVLLR